MGDGNALTEAALAPLVRFLSNVRMVLVLALMVGGVSGVSSALVAVIALAALPGNVILLFRWGRTVGSYVPTIWFAAWDAVVVAGVLTVGAASLRSLSVWGGSYCFVSALLSGIIYSKKILFLWCGVPLMASISLLVFFDCSFVFVGVVLAFLAVGASLIVAGRRLVFQVARVEGLAADASKARSLQAGAEERLVLARDLHDTMAKSAAGVRMLAETLSASLDAEGSPRASDAQVLFRAADSLSSEARTVLDELRSLPTEDLRERLAQDAETWGARVGIAIDVEASGRPIGYNSSTTWQVQRALGEVLANVEQHAKAEHVWLRIDGADSNLDIFIEDDGVGFPEKLLENPELLRGSGHYGLCGVGERLSAIGGCMILGAGEGGGARVELVIPVAAPRATRSGLVEKKSMFTNPWCRILSWLRSGSEVL